MGSCTSTINTIYSYNLKNYIYSMRDVDDESLIKDFFDKIWWKEVIDTLSTINGVHIRTHLPYNYHEDLEEFLKKIKKSKNIIEMSEKQSRYEQQALEEIEEAIFQRLNKFCGGVDIIVDYTGDFNPVKNLNLKLEMLCTGSYIIINNAQRFEKNYYRIEYGEWYDVFMKILIKKSVL